MNVSPLFYGLIILGSALIGLGSFPWIHLLCWDLFQAFLEVHELCTFYICTASRGSTKQGLSSVLWMLIPWKSGLDLQIQRFPLSPGLKYPERIEVKEVVYFPPLPRVQDHLGNRRGQGSEKQMMV